MIWIERLIAFAVILQTIELFWVRPWRWSRVAEEYPTKLRAVLSADRTILAVQLFAAGVSLVFPFALSLAIMLVTTWLIAWRWRGTFNGGSDTMTVHILAAGVVHSWVPEWEYGCLIFVALQITLSYFVAGLAKLSQPEWRNGEALRKFLGRAGRPVSPEASLPLSWLIMLFEVGFPLAIFSPYPFVILGVAFNLANVYIFGLNRFFWVWLAGYPAFLLLAAK